MTLVKPVKKKKEIIISTTGYLKSFDQNGNITGLFTQKENGENFIKRVGGKLEQDLSFIKDEETRRFLIKNPGLATDFRVGELFQIKETK